MLFRSAEALRLGLLVLSWLLELPSQNAPMTTAPSSTSAISIDPRIRVIAAGILAAILEGQVRLFGSRARGATRPDSDLDLLITVPDQWLRARIVCGCWAIFGVHSPAIVCRWTCFSTAKAR